MSLPAPNLDNRDFQKLVSEARERITRTCPEWTDHNVSDPGITLIELFAWMTEMLVYRINRLPSKVHIALLDLLGIALDAPRAASTDVRFRLASPATGRVTIEGRRATTGARTTVATPRTPTEVATRRSPAEEPVVFEVRETFVIRPVKLAAYTRYRAGRFDHIGVSADGQARPQGQEQLPFSDLPVEGEALYLGFDAPLDRLVLQVDVSAERAQGVGSRPDSPPLVWEVFAPGGQWEQATVLADGTGGFNYGSGIVELQLPKRSAETRIEGDARPLHWLRCRVVHNTRASNGGPPYNASPRITRISSAVVGALVEVGHAASVPHETIGHSDGTASQSFHVRHAPALPLEGSDETLEVRTDANSDWVPWKRQDSFGDSKPNDKHFTFDPVAGEIEFGPAIRQDDGSWKQYGAIPRKGATLRISYRHGGGQRGNVGADAICVLRTAVKGVASVTNPAPARGGVDAETLERAEERAALELRATYRAVTAEDFKFFAEENRRVARAICVDSAEGVTVHILPVASETASAPARADLLPPQDLRDEVRAALDHRRLLGSPPVPVRPVALIWVSVEAHVRVAPGADAPSAQRAVEQKLHAYLHPWTGGTVEGNGGGWPFGRDLTEGELYGVIQGMRDIDAVTSLSMYRFDPATKRNEQTPIGPRLELGPAATIVSGEHTVLAQSLESVLL
ncbi:MAG: putative baseplate assembly protein [Solirubrobacteraceae bacterium]